MAKKTKTKADRTPKVWALLRIVLGLIFIWAFADKMIGLGYATCRISDPATKVESVQMLCTKSVAKGSSPTMGFLKFGAKGPLKDFYNKLAGNKVVDVLFMTGLLLIGLCLLSGIGIKVATVTGMLLVVLMWSVALPPENHPFLDEHIVYALALLGINLANDGQVWGLGSWWKRQSLVVKNPILE